VKLFREKILKIRTWNIEQLFDKIKIICSGYQLHALLWLAVQIKIRTNSGFFLILRDQG